VFIDGEALNTTGPSEEPSRGVDQDGQALWASPVWRTLPDVRASCHWKMTTFVGALRLEGMTAPMILDGAMHGVAFIAYVEQVLVPTLSPGDMFERLTPLAATVPYHS